MKLLHHFNRDESGQDMIEYALIALVIALGVIVGMTTLATAINAEFARIAGKLT